MRLFNNWQIDVFLFFVQSCICRDPHWAKTYIIDIDQERLRSIYLGVANTTVGYIFLLLDELYELIYLAMGEHIILVMTIFMMAGLLRTFKFKAENNHKEQSVILSFENV
ncbi:MAG: hypothetical protein ACI9LE_001695 [Paraglaciecola sp.]